VAQEKDDFSETAINDESQVIRRKDIVALGGNFTSALKPLSKILGEMKLQNISTKLTSIHVRRLVWWMTLLSLGGGYTVYMDHKNVSLVSSTAEMQSSMMVENKELHNDLEQTNRELRELLRLAKETNKTVEDIEEEQDSKTQLELVPETDPVKAKKAPVKLRVLPPVKVEQDASAAKKMSSAPAKKPKPVDIPLSAKHF